jgi:hypothetical protein
MFLLERRMRVLHFIVNYLTVFLESSILAPSPQKPGDKEAEMQTSAVLSHNVQRHRYNRLPEIFRRLDLACVADKVSDNNPEWSPAKARQAVEDYRYFLALCALYPDRPLVPSEDIDEVWHTHILFLKKYLDDCVTMFDETLFHWPYFGLQSEEALREGIAHLRDTLPLYRAHFGFVPPTYDRIEEEISSALRTRRLTSQRGLSGTINLSDPTNAHWLHENV